MRQINPSKTFSTIYFDDRNFLRTILGVVLDSLNLSDTLKKLIKSNEAVGNGLHCVKTHHEIEKLCHPSINLNHRIMLIQFAYLVTRDEQFST